LTGALQLVVDADGINTFCENINTIKKNKEALLDPRRVVSL